MDDTERLRDRFRGALLGTFVGDALGMPLEGRHRGALAGRHNEVREMLAARLGRGTYTDDTQLTIALAEAALECSGDLDLDLVAHRFGQAYDSERGYGGNSRRILAALRRGEPWEPVVESHLLPGGSWANGAAMRVAPVALAYYPDIAAVARNAEAQAEITGHIHPVGKFGARLQALAVLRGMQRGAGGEAFEGVAFLESILDQAPDDYRRPLEWILTHADAAPDLAARILGTGSRASHSVPMALWCFLSSPDDLEEALVRAVNAGGDTDTLGAMAGAVAGGYCGATALPRRWVEALENNHKGRDWVLELADRLWQRSRPGLHGLHGS